MTIPAGAEESFARDVLKQLAERSAECQDFSEVVRGEVGACTGRIWAFPGDLNDTNDLPSSRIGALIIL